MWCTQSLGTGLSPQSTFLPPTVWPLSSLKEGAAAGVGGRSGTGSSGPQATGVADQPARACHGSRPSTGPDLPLLPAAESPCRGEVVREVIHRQKGYASCATASKVPTLECRGGCGPQCCQPTRSKRRKYVLQCTDGTSVVEEVARNLECACRPCS